MTGVYVVMQEGVPIAVYDQEVATPSELWEKYGVCSVFSLPRITEGSNVINADKE